MLASFGVHLRLDEGQISDILGAAVMETGHVEVKNSSGAITENSNDRLP